jgi:hypothetical protein
MACASMFIPKKLILLAVLSQEYDVTVDYFVSYHGKSICDSWFSILNGIYETHTMRGENTLVTNTEELIQLLTKGLIECNKNSSQRNLHKKADKGLLFFDSLTF